MAEATLDLRHHPKDRAYAQLHGHMINVMAGIDDDIAGMATLSALLHHAFGHLWTDSTGWWARICFASDRIKARWVASRSRSDAACAAVPLRNGARSSCRTSSDSPATSRVIRARSQRSSHPSSIVRVRSSRFWTSIPRDERRSTNRMPTGSSESFAGSPARAAVDAPVHGV
jgi:hypothetical protein